MRSTYMAASSLALACGLAAAQEQTTTPTGTTLEEVTVQGTADQADRLPDAYSGGQMARGGRLGLLGAVDTMDAPFHIDSYTAQAIADRQAATAADLLAADPSVHTNTPGGDVADGFFMRGFAVGGDNIGEMAMDGLYGVAPNYRLFPDYIERVEVLKGPAAMLYGMSPNGGVGGAINIVPKRAQQADLTRLSADYGTRSQAGGAIDLSRRFGAGKEWGLRFNGSHHAGDTALDHQHRKATVGALALDYQDARTTALLHLIHQREAVDAPTRRPSLAAGLAVPAAPDGRRNITQPWEWYDATERSALLRVQHQLNSQWALFAGWGVVTSGLDRLFNTPTITNAAGDTRVTPARARFEAHRDTMETGLRGRFNTGAVAHQATLQWSRYNDYWRMGSTPGAAYASNIYQPLLQPEQDPAAPATVPRRSASTLSGIALSDTLYLLDDRLLVMLGLRHQRVDSSSYDSSTGAVSARYVQSANTPMIGIVAKPFGNHISLYANAVQGLSKGDTAPTTADNAGEVFAPYKSKQREVGVKIDHGKLMTTLSLFQITKPSGLMVGNTYSVDGEQRNRGLELSVQGTPAPGWRVYGGVTGINAKLTGTGNAATQGNTAVGVPRWQAAFNLEHDLQALPGLTLTGSLNHSGAMYVDVANSQRLPGWTTADLGLRWRTAWGGRATTLRAAVRNVTNRSYWAAASQWGTLVTGAPRTLQVSATVDF
ncbi:MAG: TonB-dependent siderophore receptor [Acidovorax sp.]